MTYRFAFLGHIMPEEKNSLCIHMGCFCVHGIMQTPIVSYQQISDQLQSQTNHAFFLPPPTTSQTTTIARKNQPRLAKLMIQTISSRRFQRGTTRRRAPLLFEMVRHEEGNIYQWKKKVSFRIQTQMECVAVGEASRVRIIVVQNNRRLPEQETSKKLN